MMCEVWVRSPILTTAFRKAARCECRILMSSSQHKVVTVGHLIVTWALCFNRQASYESRLWI